MKLASRRPVLPSSPQTDAVALLVDVAVVALLAAASCWGLGVLSLLGGLKLFRVERLGELFGNVVSCHHGRLRVNCCLLVSLEV